MNQLVEFEGQQPRVGRGTFIADTARIIGRVELEDEVSIWYGAILRGDVGSIRVGRKSNIQDLACLHMTGGVSNVVVGAQVTVGHGAIIHGATVGDGALIGMGSILLDNVAIGAESIVGAGALVTPGTKVPPRSLVLGSPARVVRALSAGEYQQGRGGALVYLELAQRFAKSRG